MLPAWSASVRTAAQVFYFPCVYWFRIKFPEIRPKKYYGVRHREEQRDVAIHHLKASSIAAKRFILNASSLRDLLL